MLDLTALTLETWELKLFDGTVLNIKKPTQQFIMDMMLNEKNLKKKTISQEAKINAVISMLTKILNNNINQITFEEEQVGDIFSLEIGLMVFEEYMKFTQGINNRPN